MAFGSPKQVDTILSTHTNVYMTISKKEEDKGGYSDLHKLSKLGSGFLDSKGMIKDEWLKIIMKYSNRLLFATDAHKKHRWKKYRNLSIAIGKWLTSYHEMWRKKFPIKMPNSCIEYLYTNC